MEQIANNPVVICDCGQECTGRGDAAGRRVIAYTIWVREDLIQDRYRRTCEKCELDRDGSLVAEGFTMLQHFPAR